MKKKIKLQQKLTLCVGLILLLSNLSLVALLLYNFQMTVSGFMIPFEGQSIEIYFADGLEKKLLILGIGIAIAATAVGTLLTWWILGRVLQPLKDLSRHMELTDRQNLVQQTQITADTREIASLIDSFNSMCSRQEQLFESQKNFASYAAHQLRTPLAVVQAELDVYRREPDRDPEDLLEKIGEQNSRMSTLVTQILNLSGIRRAELKDRIPVVTLLEEVMQDLEDFADEKCVSVSAQNFCGEEVQVLGSHALLYQAFYNLVENGIKYNHPGGKVTVQIQTEQQKIRIRIQDTGPGIPEAERTQVFCPFYRCRQKDGPEGSGIGLALAQQVLEHHKGAL